MSSPALHELSATAAIDLFRRRELSPVELLDAVTARVEAAEPTLNAVCDRLYDQARVAAEASASRYLGKDGGPRPLDGVPVAAKEEQPMAGRPHQLGSLAYADMVATETHPLIERIQAAGGVIHIRTTTPEFCCAGFTHSMLWGVTRNPWNTAFSPGGSSGGSGAALAAGYAPLATGSDIGGSIRIPASFCGVVGYKPPFGRVPAIPPFTLDQYCHDGPMARTVADTALLTNVIAGRHPHDVVSLPAPPPLPLELQPVAGMRVALCVQLGDYAVEPVVAANTRRVADTLRGLGVEVEEVELPWTTAAIREAAWAHFGGIFAADVAADLAAHGDRLTPYARKFAESTRNTTGFVDGIRIEGELYRPLGELLERVDALLCPTMATDGYPAGEDYVDTPCVVDGTVLPDYLMGAMTLPFNIASRCPVLSVPSGLAGNGVPTGAQLVGRTYEDPAVFRLAMAYEAAVGGFPLAPFGG
jgi:aspartyl-tRNA(Asn)/glutamyl-tRNA(Gln) amidotransferase subunit A